MEQKLIGEIDEMMKVKTVENSTLMMGYNEEDYIVTSKEWENCRVEHIQPKGYERAEKWVRPKEMDKQYKFTLDKF